MKIFFKLAASLMLTGAMFTAFSCSVKERTQSLPEAESLIQFMSGDVLVTISEGAPIFTKTSDGVSCYTVKGKLNSISYSLYVQSSAGNDGLVFNRIFSEGGTWIFSEVYFNGSLVNCEYADLSEDPDGIETKASRRENEKYIDCVKRVRESLKEKSESNTDVACEFVSCGALAAVVGIVDCAEYGDKY